jgi:hypothetical protein
MTAGCIVPLGARKVRMICVVLLRAVLIQVSGYFMVENATRSLYEYLALIIKLLSPCSKDPPEKITDIHVVKKFNTAFTKARH